MSETEVERIYLSDGRYAELKRRPKYGEAMKAVAAYHKNETSVVLELAGMLVLVSGQRVTVDEICDMDFCDGSAICDMVGRNMVFGGKA